MSYPVKLSISDEEIRGIAESQKQLDVRLAQQIRQKLSSLNFGGASVQIQIQGLERLESKPIEEYEAAIRERLEEYEAVIRERLEEYSAG